MSSMIGVWKLVSFDKGGVQPFGDDPIGSLVFFRPADGGSYMGAHLTSPAGQAGPTFSFSATFEEHGTTYSFTPTATNNAKEFGVGDPKGPKDYIVESRDGVDHFVESWVDGGAHVQVVWRRLDAKGQ